MFVSCCAVHVECVLDVFPCYTYYGKLLSPIITTNQIILTTIFGGIETFVPSFLFQAEFNVMKGETICMIHSLKS